MNPRQTSNPLPPQSSPTNFVPPIVPQSQPPKDDLLRRGLKVFGYSLAGFLVLDVLLAVFGQNLDSEVLILIIPMILIGTPLVIGMATGIVMIGVGLLRRKKGQAA